MEDTDPWRDEPPGVTERRMERHYSIHQCLFPTGCESQVVFDDEPCCFTHSPDDGSSLIGFSAEAYSNGKLSDEVLDQLHAFLKKCVTENTSLT